MDTLATSAETRREQSVNRGLLRPRRLLLAADVAAACLGLFASIAILSARGHLETTSGVGSLLMGMLVVIVSLALMVRAGQYTNRRRMSHLADAVALVRSVLIALAVVSLFEYLSNGFFVGVLPSRLVVLSSALVFLLFAASARVLLTGYQRRQFVRGQMLGKILVVGSGAAAQEFTAFLEQRPWLGVGLQGHVTFEGKSGAGKQAGPATRAIAHLTNDLAGLKELNRVMRASGAGEVVVALDAEDQALIPQVTELLCLANIPFKVVPTLFEKSYRAAELLGFHELPVINVDVDPLDRVARLFKRMLDLSVAMVVCVLGIPLLLAVVAAILIEDGRPVIYKQERVGKNGRQFMLYKFRTMVKNADELLAQLREQNEAGGDQIFKMRNDPRITKVGRLLRKLSLDELPQLVNVCRGEMSVVGPRPPLPSEVSTYEQQHCYRLKGLPGITGLWQVSGRSDLGFDDMVRLDRYYLDNWSLRLDLQIMLRTIYVVLARKGAY